jgi:hypothetical protein
MESLFDPPRSASPAAAADRATRTLTQELEEILRLMETTDRRLASRRNGRS